nr:selenoprotein H [Tanacetum cinerariifolium]
MAPTKRKTETKPSENVQTSRVTRSSTRQETPKPAAVVEPPVPKAKKAKATPKVKPETKQEEEPVAVTSPKTENGKTAPKAKKAKAALKVKPDPKAETKEEEPAVVTSSKAENGNVSNKTVVVEHCKQCTQFKIRG